MRIALLIPIVIVLIMIIRHRSTARTIAKTSKREVWARASDTRYPRTPRSHPFGRSKPLK